MLFFYLQLNLLKKFSYEIVPDVNLFTSIGATLAFEDWAFTFGKIDSFLLYGYRLGLIFPSLRLTKSGQLHNLHLGIGAWLTRHPVGQCSFCKLFR